jgi:PLP dependent protein
MFDHIESNITALRKEVKNLEKTLKISPPVQILVATKYATLEETFAIIKTGITHIGENKVQELVRKKPYFQSKDVKFHMMGQLQSNKINKCLETADFIDSIDRFSLLQKINSKCLLLNKKINCLIQVNIGNDPMKAGFSEKDLDKNHSEIFGFSNIDIEGIMIVAPRTDYDQTRSYFKKSKLLFNRLVSIYPHLTTLSMGMSNDYKIAIEEGATQIRVGRKILSKEKKE